MVILRILTMFIVAGGDLEDTLEVFLDYDGCNVAIETRVKEMMFFSSGVKNGRIK